MPMAVSAPNSPFFNPFHIHICFRFCHITLVRGQFERWGITLSHLNSNNRLSVNGDDRIVLLGRRPFSPPPTNPESNNKHPCTTDLFRRGANGRSFSNSRTFGKGEGGSETITFGFEVDCNDGEGQNFLLPWEDKKTDFKTTKAEKTEKDAAFACPSCGKRFREQRSLKSHVANSSVCSLADKGQQLANATICPVWKCAECERVFKTEDARNQHVKAKHTGKFLDLKPNWQQQDRQQRQDDVAQEVNFFGRCSICNFAFETDSDLKQHMALFSPAVDDKEKQMGKEDTFHCDVCHKAFRNERDMKQHRNSNRCKPLSPPPPQQKKIK